MVEGSAKCIKYLMFFFNFIFFLFGLGIIIGGALSLTVYSEYVDFTGSTGKAVPIFIICIGVFIFLTGFFGCCGAIKENYCMLATYAFIMVLLLILELAAGISGYVLRDDIDQLIDDNMGNLQQEYNASDSTRQVFDHMQQSLKCCGTSNYTKWFGFNDTAYNMVPMSCCINDQEGCNMDVSPDELVAQEKIYVDLQCCGVDNYTDWLGYNETDANLLPESCCSGDSPAEDCNLYGNANFLVYPDPCYPALKDLLLSNIGIIAGVAIGIAVIEIFGIAFACCLMRKIKGEYETV